jgi:hypothetical protein
MMFEQERVIVRLQQRVMTEAAIVACFLSGSYGRRQEDGYSDLDVALVYRDLFSLETGWRQRVEFVQSVTPYVPAKSFDATHVRPYFHIALYSNGTKADYRFETIESLTPQPMDRDIRILKDRNGWAEQYQAACAQAIQPQPRLTSEELAQLDDRFWIMYWDVLRLVLRGNYDKPFSIYLELLHFTLPTFLQVLPPEEPARQALLQAQFNKDTRATAVHLRQLLTAYLAARTAVVRRLHLQFEPNTRFESEIQKLVESRSR